MRRERLENRPRAGEVGGCGDALMSDSVCKYVPDRDAHASGGLKTTGVRKKRDGAGYAKWFSHQQVDAPEWGCDPGTESNLAGRASSGCLCWDLCDEYMDAYKYKSTMC